MSDGVTNQSAGILAPTIAGAARPHQRLANATGTVITTSTALTVGDFATLVNDTTAVIRVQWRANSSGSTALTDVALGPYGRIDWLVTPATSFVAIRQDGTSAYEAHVWTSSGAFSTTGTNA